MFRVPPRTNRRYNVELIEAFVALFGFACLLWLSRGHPALMLILFVSYSLRLVLVYVDVYVANIPGSGDDTLMFDSWAKYWIITSPAQTFENFYMGSRLYGWFVSIVYSLFYENRFVAQWCNIMLACSAVRFFYLTAKQLYNPRVARSLSIVFAFWPTYLLFTSILLREAFVVFGLMAGIYYLVSWQNKGRSIYLVYSCLALMLGVAMHSGVILALAALPVAVLYSQTPADKLWGNRRSRVGRIFLVSTMAIAALIIFSSGVGLQKFSRNENLSASNIFELQNNSARNRTAYLSDIDGSSYTQLVLQVPQRIVYFFLKPMPWDVEIMIDVVGFIDALFFLAIIIIIFTRLRSRRITRNELIILGIGVLVAATYAVGTSNYGTALRHRMKVLPIVLLIAVRPVTLHRIQQTTHLPRKRRTKLKKRTTL